MISHARRHHLATTLFVLFLAGGLGALARYGLSGWVQTASGSAFPWGTFAVNVLGALLFGIVYGVGTERELIPPFWRAILLVGFMGAFTTFSTLAFETAGLLKESQWIRAVANYLGQGVAGIVAVLLGMLAGRFFGGG